MLNKSPDKEVCGQSFVDNSCKRRCISKQVHIVLISFIFLTQWHFFVGCDKSSIAVKEKPISWISEEDFAIMMKLSFPYSTCCSVYISPHAVQLEPFFQQFVRIFPYDYATNKSLWHINCKAFFLLTQREEEVLFALTRMPLRATTTEVLIILNIDLDPHSRVLNESLYGNMNVNIAARNGLWILSDFYLSPRVFKKSQRFEDMVHKKGVVDHQGRRIKALTFHYPPYVYVPRSVKKEIDGKLVNVYPTEGSFKFDGVEMQLFLLLAEILNVTWTLLEQQEPVYGKIYNDTYRDTGIIGQVQDNAVDLAFGGIWIIYQTYANVNMTESWHDVSLQFLVPRPRPLSRFWALTRPFSPLIWILFFHMVILQSLYMNMRARINPYTPIRFRSFIITLIEMTGRLLGTFVPHDVTDVRFVLHMWHMIGVIMVTVYSCSLAADLTNSGYEERIDTLEQFVKSNLSWGSRNIISLSDILDPTSEYFDKIAANFVLLSNEERRELLLSRKYAVLGRLIQSVFFPDDFRFHENSKDLRLMSEPLGVFYHAFAVQPWLQESTNLAMLRLKAAGFVHYHLRDVIRRKARTSFSEVLIEYDKPDGQPRVLSLTPLSAGIVILIVGLIISTIVFYLELKSAAGTSKTILTVLKEIKKSRIKFNFQPPIVIDNDCQLFCKTQNKCY